MFRKRSGRSESSGSFIEPLESRRLLSHSVFATRLQEFTTAESGTFGEQLTSTFTAKLTAAGLPLRTATINFEFNGSSVATGVTGRSGYAAVEFNEFYLGKYPISALFAGATRYVKSTSGMLTTTITPPKSFNSLADGTEWATVTAGTGASTLQENGAFTADYAGYLQSNGEVFDSSFQDGQQLQDTDSSSGLIVGFAEGIEGMKVGETRVILIPSADGYGATGNGSVPANADLVFIVHMDAARVNGAALTAEHTLRWRVAANQNRKKKRGSRFDSAASLCLECLSERYRDPLLASAESSAAAAGTGGAAVVGIR